MPMLLRFYYLRTRLSYPDERIGLKFMDGECVIHLNSCELNRSCVRIFHQSQFSNLDPLSFSIADDISMKLPPRLRLEVCSTLEWRRLLLDILEKRV